MKATLIEKAMRLALRAHESQKRKETDLPYIGHPFMVALTLMRHGFPEPIVAAGLVHDVLEDTEVSREGLESELGSEVVHIVGKLTQDNSLSWEEKKAKYFESVREGSEAVKAVATADKIHNLESLLIAYETQGRDLWKKFNRGRDSQIWFYEEMFKALSHKWEHSLLEEYRRLHQTLRTLA